jgi:hypothetical protein
MIEKKAKLSLRGEHIVFWENKELMVAIDSPCLNVDDSSSVPTISVKDLVENLVSLWEMDGTTEVLEKLKELKSNIAKEKI